MHFEASVLLTVFGYKVLCIGFQVAALLSLALRAHVPPQEGLSQIVSDEAIFKLTHPVLGLPGKSYL